MAGGSCGSRHGAGCAWIKRAGGARKITRHHLVPQSWFRTRGLPHTIRDADANIVPLCTNCHRSVENDIWARRMLRKVLTQTEVSFVIQLRGKPWLDRVYPPPPAKAAVL